MNKEIAIGIDLGGTRIKGVLLRKDGQILQQVVRSTEDQSSASFQLWKGVVKEIVLDFQQQIGRQLPIGLSAPGLPAINRQSIAFMPGRLEGLEYFNWATHLQTDHLLVLNDAKAALIAESQFGVAKGYQHVAMYTLGTGIGGAIMIDGQLYTGNFNRAGHFGHTSLDTDGEAGIVNTPGSLESFFGNATIIKRSMGRFKSTANLVEAYQKGDAFAKLVWLESIKKLAVGICSLINVLSPELIVLGGGITQAGDALLVPLREFMDIYEWRPGGVKTEIKIAKFEEYAGAVGAASYVLLNN